MIHLCSHDTDQVLKEYSGFSNTKVHVVQFSPNMLLISHLLKLIRLINVS